MRSGQIARRSYSVGCGRGLEASLDRPGNDGAKLGWVQAQAKRTMTYEEVRVGKVDELKQHTGIGFCI